MHRRLKPFARVIRRQARDVEQETEERNIQQRNICHKNEASLAEFVDQHHFICRTVLYKMNSAIGADKKAVGYYFRIFDPGKNGLQSTDDLSMKLMCEFCLGRSKHKFSLSFNPGRRQREICRDVFARSGSVQRVRMGTSKRSSLWTHDTPERVRTENWPHAARRFLLHRNTCVPGHTNVLLEFHESWMTRKRTNLRTSLVRSPRTTWHDASPCCKRDLVFLSNCPATPENLGLWAHERTPGIPRNVDDLETVEFAYVLGAIAEDQHLT